MRKPVRLALVSAAVLLLAEEVKAGREPSLCGVITQGRPGSNLHSSEDRLAGSTDSKGPVRGFAYLKYMMFYILEKD